MRVFTGQNFRGQKDNADIEHIQFDTSLNGNGKEIRFYALTKDNPSSSSKKLYLEGTIDLNYGIDITHILWDEQSSPLYFDRGGLERSLLNAYRNLENSKELEANGNSDKARSGSNDSVPSVSDIQGNNSARYRSNGSHGNGNGNGSERNRHVRIGHLRQTNGSGVPVSPSVVHPEEFSDEELLSLGFAPDGTPSIEAVEEYSTLDSLRKKQIIRRRNLRELQHLKELYGSATIPSRN